MRAKTAVNIIDRPLRVTDRMTFNKVSSRYTTSNSYKIQFYIKMSSVQYSKNALLIICLIKEVKIRNLNKN